MFVRFGAAGGAKLDRIIGPLADLVLISSAEFGGKCIAGGKGIEEEDQRRRLHV